MAIGTNRYNDNTQNNPTPIAISVVSLAPNGFVSSNAIANSTNKFIDAGISGQIKLGGLTADGHIYVYAAFSDDNVIYTGGLGATGSAITWGTTPATSTIYGYRHLETIGIFDVGASDANKNIPIHCSVSLIQANGFLRENWLIVIENRTNQAFNADQSGLSINYTGLKYEIA